MTNLDTQKKRLLDTCMALKSTLMEKLPNSQYVKVVDDLVTDLSEDKQIITVLGEFKRGKSTLINAMLGEALLPSDVTPTTAAIHVITHAEQHGFHTIYEDGRKISQELDRTNLANYTYEKHVDIQSIHHIEIETPFTKLEPNITLIDTPGVGDLNEHRLDVTYSYIPRSNLIIFVLDSTTPIRKEEMYYLEHSVLKMKFGEIIFIANFNDRLDEEEEEESREYITSRLNKVMNETPYSLFMLSSKEALSQPNNVEFNRLLSYVNQQIGVSDAAIKKMNFFASRVDKLFQLVEDEVQALEMLKSASHDELLQAKAEIEQFKEKKDEHASILEDYIQARGQEIIQITYKSIDYEKEKLKEYISDAIDLFDNKNFQQFVEKNIPVMIKNRIHSWITAYSPHIEILLEKLEYEIVKGLSQVFEEDIKALKTTDRHGLLTTVDTSIQTRTGSSDMSVKSGLITGGAAVSLMLLSGGLIIPLVILAGNPFISKHLHENKLKKLKTEATPLIMGEIDTIIDNLKTTCREYIENEVAVLQNKGLIRYEEQTTLHENRLNNELKIRESNIKSEMLLINLDEIIALKNKFMPVSEKYE